MNQTQNSLSMPENQCVEGLRMMLQGMAMVMIGGLIASTILTLLLMPTFYLLTDKRERKRRKEERKARQ